MALISQDPRDKRSFAPSGKKPLSNSVSGPWNLFDVRTVHPSSQWPLEGACSTLPPPRPLGSLILLKDIFYCLVFLRSITLPDLKESKCWEWHGALAENWSQLCPSRCGSLGWLKVSGWNKEVGKKQSLQTVPWLTRKSPVTRILFTVWC